MVNPNDDPIELTPSRYEAWRERFTEERDRIHDSLTTSGLDGDIVHIEHVGSTAVPDLAAKDIVDIDVVVADDAVASISHRLETTLGGTRLENTANWHPLFRIHDGQRFNDHVFAVSGDKWKVSVVTRDVLRKHADLRREYERLKRESSFETDDLTTYSRDKTTFIERLLQIAQDDDELAFDFTIPTDPQAGQTQSN
jgi:GrpB-like predicted nucleotidyltransferase (UPF0157 family)